MVIGLTGRTGVSVLSRVVAVCRIDQELVPIPQHNLEERHALEKVTKPERAMRNLVQVIFAHIMFFMAFLGDCNCFFFSFELCLISVRCGS